MGTKGRRAQASVAHRVYSCGMSAVRAHAHVRGEGERKPPSRSPSRCANIVLHIGERGNEARARLRTDGETWRWYDRQVIDRMGDELRNTSWARVLLGGLVGGLGDARYHVITSFDMRDEVCGRGGEHSGVANAYVHTVCAGMLVVRSMISTFG